MIFYASGDRIFDDAEKGLRICVSASGYTKWMMDKRVVDGVRKQPAFGLLKLDKAKTNHFPFRVEGDSLPPHN